jgi:hypothetical protein
MSNDKGIFEPKEGFASEPPSRSPFAVDDAVDSPFASAPDRKSPFSMNDDSSGRSDSGGTNIPGKRSDPFGATDSKSPFGYEPPVAGFGGSPFEGSPSPSASKDSPFAMADVPKDDPQQKVAEATSPFAGPRSGVPSDAIAAAVAAAAGSTPAPASSTPPPLTPTPEPTPAPAQTPTPAPAVSATPAPVTASDSDSSSIRQLELRAIFGVDRELSEHEILQRSRALPGIRHLGRIADADIGMIDGIKRVLANLDFGGGKVQLQCNNAPIEFIREGSVLLAVQTDGSFAPGVRETLIIAARELGRM